VTSEMIQLAISQRGWVALDLPDPASVFAVRDLLLEWLRRRYPDLRSLEQYDGLGLADDSHFELLYGLSVFYWEADLARTIIKENIELFRAVIGADLHIQRYPYLRVVRPGHPFDASPLHRDTYYGASPYEISVVIPFTEMDHITALRVISGSHLAADSEYLYTQTVRDDIAIGSVKHQLGFPYAPRLLDPSLKDRAEAVPLRVGQALIFPLSLVHGNTRGIATGTRFSSDVRLVNSWAPVRWSRGVHADYFVPLCASPVTNSARRYLELNRLATLGRENATE
jgi:hypothetical protein